MKPKTILMPVFLLLMLLVVWGCRPVPVPTEAPTQPTDVEVITTEEPDTASTVEESIEEPDAEPAAEDAVEAEEVPAEEPEDDAEETEEDTEESAEEEESTAASAAGDDTCIDCHTDKQALIDTSDPVEEVESENEGAG